MEDIKSWESKFQPCQYSDRLLNLIVEINKTSIEQVDTQDTKKAMYYARKYHGSQLRKSGHPYYYHPIEVAYLFAEHVGKNMQKYYTTVLIIIAILHDTIEDTKLTYQMIVEIFGRQVADGVQDLTRIKFDKKITAAESVIALFSQYKNAILYIKLFDRLHNMRTIHVMPPEKIDRIVEETLYFFVPLAIFLELDEIEAELREICGRYSKITVVS